MKICEKCRTIGKDTDNFCPKCASKMIFADDSYKGTFKSSSTKEKSKNFPFVAKLVTGILGMLSISIFKLAGIECLLFGVMASILSLSMCAWNNKLSAFIPAVLFFISSCYFDGHLLTQTVAVAYMIIEIVAGVKINKKEKRNNP